MSEYESDLLAFQPKQRDRDSLCQDIREVQRLVLAKNTEILELRRQLSELRCTVASQRQNEQTSGDGRDYREQLMGSSDMRDDEARERQFRPFNSKKWIRAHRDYPDDMSYFGRYPTALVYDLHEGNFYLRPVNELPGKGATISLINQAIDWLLTCIEINTQLYPDCHLGGALQFTSISKPWLEVQLLELG
ncbi:hypothetical protein FHL15_010668 [Xylaria flabelliformis]|uniref:Uncharacterized protein n=1 Tax=Xylaria flabelliformis TaxID=2512241 RepID=A0A553HKK3_9PEZI|nr:hypothetical protein FHL15_010668 [Xylaria flabelliformis]